MDKQRASHLTAPAQSIAEWGEDLDNNIQKLARGLKRHRSDLLRQVSQQPDFVKNLQGRLAACTQSSALTALANSFFALIELKKYEKADDILTTEGKNNLVLKTCYEQYVIAVAKSDHKIAATVCGIVKEYDRLLGRIKVYQGLIKKIEKGMEDYNANQMRGRHP